MNGVVIMAPALIAENANAFAPLTGGVEVLPRDAEMAVKIAGLLLGRPFDNRHAIAPARIIAFYRAECAAAERLRLMQQVIKEGRKVRAKRKPLVRLFK